jgi:hypothetical protein
MEPTRSIPPSDPAVPPAPPLFPEPPQREGSPDATTPVAPVTVRPADPPAGFPSPPAAAAAPSLWGQVLRVAWLSIGLGLVLELVLLIVAAYAGLAGDTPKPFVSDLAQKVSWGFIVCVGIAFGSTAAKARSAVMGVLGLFSAPAGFAVARAVQKGVSQALSLSGPAAVGASPFLLGAIKGLEYGILGAVIGWIGKKVWGGLGAHAGAGALIGVVFGSAILLVMAALAPAPPPAIQWVSRGINELLFPIGCSLVLYASGVMAKRLE